MPHVKITVRCLDDHVIGTWTDAISEKYPFWCQACDEQGSDGDLRQGKYPWSLTTEIVNDQPG